MILHASHANPLPPKKICLRPRRRPPPAQRSRHLNHCIEKGPVVENCFCGIYPVKLSWLHIIHSIEKGLLIVVMENK